MQQMRLAAILRLDAQQAKAVDLTQALAALGVVHADLVEPEFERGIDRREDRPWIDHHAERIGREFGHRVEAGGDAAIGGELRLPDDRFAFLAGLQARRLERGVLVVEPNA